MVLRGEEAKTWGGWGGEERGRVQDPSWSTNGGSILTEPLQSAHISLNLSLCLDGSVVHPHICPTAAALDLPYVAMLAETSHLTAFEG